ncbi:hypothetical protein AAVH_21587 [Aphelenchoides avenae]|nr:hypothetical protein AAVH_21587 [Aphelenchus avenae]
MLTQAVYPSRSDPINYRLKVNQPTAVTPAFMFANDDDSLQIGSFVQKMDAMHGPRPKPPPTTTSMPDLKRNGPNTIESMLQMIGLCQGHQDL